MKRFTSLILCALLLLSVIPHVSASETRPQDVGEVIYSSKYLTNDGITVIDEVVALNQTRSTDKTYYRSKSFYDGDTLIAFIKFEATFRYDGSTVTVISKTVTDTDTYASWSYVQNSFTSSGGTVTLSGELTKWLIINSPFTMTLSCDINGNISYT